MAVAAFPFYPIFDISLLPKSSFSICIELKLLFSAEAALAGVRETGALSSSESTFDKVLPPNKSSISSRGIPFVSGTKKNAQILFGLLASMDLEGKKKERKINLTPLKSLRKRKTSSIYH